jgi:hypothetical protein
MLFFLPFVITDGRGKGNYNFLKIKVKLVSLGITCFPILLSDKHSKQIELSVP